MTTRIWQIGAWLTLLTLLMTGERVLE